MPAELGPVMGFQKAAAVMGVRDLMSTPPLSGDVLATFDLEQDRGRFDAMEALMTPRPRLGAFAARGGKLLVYQGWADPITPPLRTLAYARDARGALGAKQADAHLRLFLIPGFNHCGSTGARPSPGVDLKGIDPLDALEAWNRSGRPPSSLPTRKIDAEGATLWTRPACAWPAHAVWTGIGDRLEATTWRCARPRRGTRRRVRGRKGCHAQEGGV